MSTTTTNNSSNNNGNPDQLYIKRCIEQYFTQLTRGCNENNLENHSIYCCHNPSCTRISSDPSLAAAKAIEYARSFNDRFLCSQMKKNKEAGYVVSIIDTCRSTNNYTLIINFIKDKFATPSQIDGIFKSAKTQDQDDYDYFQGLDLIETRKTFKLLNEQGRDDISNALIEVSTNLSASLKYNSTTYKKSTALRPFVFLLQNPLIYDLEYTNVLTNFCSAIFNLDTPMMKILHNWFNSFTKEILYQYLTNFEQFISVRLMTSEEIALEEDYPIIGACMILEILYKINETKDFANYTEFYNDLINMNLDLYTDYSNWTYKSGFTYTSFPFILDTQIKSTYLQIENTLEQKRHRSSPFAGLGIIFEYLVFRVHRNNIIMDTLNEIQKYKQHPEELKKELKIQFIGEDGIDQGGVQKEFFQIVIRKLFDPEYGMFKYNETNRTWWINPLSSDLLEFELIGIVLGLALYNTTILDVHFPLAVYKKLLKMDVGLEDVESVDPVMYQSLLKLRDSTEDVSHWMTYFTVTYDHYGEIKMVELKKGGDDILVTNENKHEYIQLYTNYLLYGSISKQWDAFYKGFSLICNSKILTFLRAEELEDLICGVEDLDFKELEKVTTYDGGYTKDDPTIIYFWEIVHSLSNEMKKKFLSFTTGSDRVPYGGLSKMPFSITKQAESDRLPSAHTCFNALILPCYQSKEKLEERLLKALNNSEGFGLR